MNDHQTLPLVLASASAARREMLNAAGLEFEQAPAAVDETEIKEKLRGDGADPDDVARTLAQLKATRISLQRPNALVIGADQILSCGDVWYDKPADRAQARAQLSALRGRSHILAAAVCVVHGESVIWHCVDRATLHVRNFSDGFLDGYLDAVGDLALASVGGYQLEGRGAQLFSRIEGDYFTILGLPLLPLLDFLRNQGVIAQ